MSLNFYSDTLLNLALLSVKNLAEEYKDISFEK